MKATEFRIGNLLHDREGRLCQVEALQDITQRGYEDETEIHAPAIHGGLTGLPHKPIPLTEEWLLKFDLCRKEWLWNGEEIEYWVQDGDGATLIKSCKYVHQLQNLFFVLTGKELEVKL
jgi:hypothetical protein